MKKFICRIFLTVVVSLLLSVSVYAVDASIDTSNASNGVVKITLKDVAGKTIKVQVQKGSDKVNYTLVSEVSNIPLQLGPGDYSVAVVEIMPDGKGKGIATEKFSVSAIDEKAMFKASNPQVDFASSSKAIPALKNVSSGKASDLDKATAVYEDIVPNFVYDNDLAARVTSGAVKEYVPVLDNVYAAKKGICYDYSSLFGGALRSQGIPTKLVMGYVPELGNGTILHAWNEIWLDGKWVAVDTTFDSSAHAAGVEYTMARDRSKAVIVRVY